jgi:DHA2 family multidrug resistance protein-like MFS transporter
MTAHPPTSAPPTGARRWLALAVLAGAVLLLAIDGTVLYLAIPSLARDLAPTSAQVLWIGDVYSLAIAGLLVSMGGLADRVGRKRLLLIGSAAFGVASVVAAFAPSAEALIAARLALGVAGATIMPSTLSIVRNLFDDDKERARGVAVWAAAAAGGAAIGPLVGGALLEHFWWGSVFLINVPVILVVIVAGAVLLPESRDPDAGRFDLVSVGLSFLAITPIVWVVKRWVDTGVTVPTTAVLVLALLAGWGFVRRQRRSASPLIDVNLFRFPAFSASILANFVAILALTGTLYFFSQYLQLVRGLSPLRAGLTELPVAVFSAAAVVVVGWVLRRLGTGPGIALSLALAAAAMVMLAVAESGGSLVWLVLALVPLGLGLGVTQTLSTNAILSAVPARKAGAASAVAETAYEMGVALGIALLGSTLTLIYRARLVPPGGLGSEDAARVQDSLASATAVLGDREDVMAAAHSAFTTAMQSTSVIAAGLLLVASVIAWRAIPRDAGTAPVAH